LTRETAMSAGSSTSPKCPACGAAPVEWTTAVRPGERSLHKCRCKDHGEYDVIDLDA